MIRQDSLYKRLLIYLLPAGLFIFFFFSGLYKFPLQWMERLTVSVVYTLQNGTRAVTGGIGGFFSHYFFLVGLHDENTRLKKEVEALHGEVYRLQEEGARAKRLREVLRFKKASPLKLIAAEVIGRATHAGSNTLMISKGTQEGIVVNQGVITPRGVVGKVVKVFPHNAQVLLMTDTKSAIAAIVQRTREEGIVHGLGGGNGAHVKYLPLAAKVAVGDVLITSGLEGSFTKGIRIGRIKEIQILDDDFFLKVIVTPEISFSDMEEVLVLDPSNRLLQASPDEVKSEGVVSNASPPPPKKPGGTPIQ